MTNSPRRFWNNRTMWGIGLASVFAWGLVGHVLVPGIMGVMTPYVLWITGLLVVLAAFEGIGCTTSTHGRAGSARWRLVLWLCVSFVLTLLLEILGTATGRIFGVYWYGDVLGPAAGHVPLIIGLFWILVVLGALRITRGTGRWFAPPLTALLCVAFDVVMEPVAMFLNYWNWENDTVPLQNYLAWFVISLVLASLFHALKLRLRSRLAVYMFCSMAGFFLGLGLFVVW